MSDNNQQLVVETFRNRVSHKTTKMINFLNSFFSLLILATTSVYLLSAGIPLEFVVLIAITAAIAMFVSFLLLEKIFPFVKGLFKGGFKNE
jgi:hypothetical protein